LKKTPDPSKNGVYENYGSKSGVTSSDSDYYSSGTNDSTGDSSNPVLNRGGVIDDGRLVNFTTLTPFFR